MWPVHATPGPSTDATSATLAALSAHAPITLVAAAVAAHASESPALASFAPHVPLAAITTTMPRQQPDRSGFVGTVRCRTRSALARARTSTRVLCRVGTPCVGGCISIFYCMSVCVLCLCVAPMVEVTVLRIHGDHGPGIQI